MRERGFEPLRFYPLDPKTENSQKKHTTETPEKTRQALDYQGFSHSWRCRRKKAKKGGYFYPHGHKMGTIFHWTLKSSHKSALGEARRGPLDFCVMAIRDLARGTEGHCAQAKK
jgi:hypothetical protein